MQRRSRFFESGPGGHSYGKVLKGLKELPDLNLVFKGLIPQLSLGPEYGGPLSLSYLRPALDVVGVFAPIAVPALA